MSNPISDNQIAHEQRQLESLRGSVLYEQELVIKLNGLLREIDEQESAAREILKVTSLDNPQDAYERRLAMEALEDLADKREETQERLSRRKAVIKNLNSQISTLNVSEIERRNKIAVLTGKLAK